MQQAWSDQGCRQSKSRLRPLKLHFSNVPRTDKRCMPATLSFNRGTLKHSSSHGSVSFCSLAVMSVAFHLLRCILSLIVSEMALLIPDWLPLHDSRDSRLYSSALYSSECRNPSDVLASQARQSHAGAMPMRCAGIISHCTGFSEKSGFHH